MKKLISLFLIGPGLFCTAQSKFGLTAGLHHSVISKASMRESSGIINFHGGIILDIPIPKSSFHIQSQVLYTSFGYDKSNIHAVDKSGFDLGNIDHHRINYIQIPVYALYRINAGTSCFKTGLGPWLAFKTGDRMTLEGGEKFGNESALPSSTISINSLLPGIGINISAELSRFIIAFEVQHSFSNLFENSNSTNIPKWKITTAGLSIGYYITSKRK